MMSCEDMLSTYEALERITDAMLHAASGAEWDRLAELEHACSAHVTRLREAGEVVLDAAGRQRKIELIKKILDDDRRIRDMTTPWMAQLSALIGSTTTQRRLANAYGGV